MGSDSLPRCDPSYGARNIGAAASPAIERTHAGGRAATLSALRVVMALLSGDASASSGRQR